MTKKRPVPRYHVVLRHAPTWVHGQVRSSHSSRVQAKRAARALALSIAPESVVMVLEETQLQRVMRTGFVAYT